ncbi:TPA: PQQ-binding-like beta-propeller repeat protein [Clostridium botulinum]|nr:PQQ-binding-like beta-propeller repeat protein [Clostridium botulinum]HCL4458540.1 PQQ-binding-like beta-propeller repeat protein [Clostridium botulinum]HCL4462452.1 PQQ-binding-like beta-propeller repeat protein [Clostridium botulinum]HCL4473511.1 PQQ-binding-like beta-propeller repeat protein [Clostridium botulinum]HCL4477101.1 PQQ-binding-like beta-propeller repeat protein [Clostridium botulinum]
MKVGDTWDRVYKAETYAEYFASFIGNGVFPNPSTNLQVIGTDKMQVIVKPGKGWINGYKYENTDDLILPIDVADGVLHRIDKIVLRYDVVEREIRVKIKKGEFASEPKAPQLTRDADMYELGLADIKVNAGSISITQVDITDLRLNKELCGIVHGTVDQVDTTTIFNQYLEWYKNITGKTEEELQNVRKNLETDFNIWFNGVKNILSGDVAGNLLNLINKNKESIDTVQNNVDEKFKTVKSELADITKQIDNIDLSADKVTLNSSNVKAKNVKGAIDELFTSASNGKNKIATAITGKGIQSSGNDSFDTLSNKIKQIPAYSPANLLIEVKRSSPITIPDYDTIGKIALDVYGKIYCKSTKILSKIDEDGYIYWQYTHDRIITSVTVKNGYVYIADWEGNRIIKINSSSGEIIWNNRYSSKYGTESIVIDDNNIIYAGTDNGKVIKIDSTGEVIWTYDKHKSRVDAIAIDKNGYIYSSGGSRLIKLCSNGGEEWIRDFGRSIASIAIDNNDYIYIGFINYGIAKINPDNGEQIWHVDLGLNISANSIFVDDYVYVASSDKIIRKISLDGLQIWKYYCDYNLRSIIKRYSYIYIGHDKIVRKLTDEIYVKK